MDTAIKTKWIEALRSGKYLQGTGCLRREETFCCLGVLCDVVDPAGWQHGAYCYNGQIRQASLPPNLKGELGLHDDDLEISCGRFVIMNDMERRSFDFIADYVEKHL